MIRIALFLLAMLAATLPAPASAATDPLDDAGTGTDAGYERSTALAIAPGAYHGNLQDDDGWRDTYKVAVPPGHYLHVEAASEDGSLFFSDPQDPWRDLAGPSYGEVIRVDTLPLSGGHAFFMLYGYGGYTFSASLLPMPDHRAADLQWEEVPLRTVAGDAPFSHLRRIEARVENRGMGDTPLTVILEEQHGDDVRRIASRALPGLPPGASVAVTAQWDQTGEVGDGVLRLRVVSPLDADQDDNVLEADAFVLVGGIGTGADLLNQRHAVPVLPVLVYAGDAHVGVYHHEGRVGVYVARYARNFFTDYSASEWVLVEVVGSPRVSTCFRSTFDACPDPAP